MRRIVLVLYVVACGEVKGTLPSGAIDAPSPADAGPDADLTGRLNVVTQTHVTGTSIVGAQAPSIDLVALRPDGSTSDMQQSDSSGHASLAVYPGGSVTAIYPHEIDTGVDLVTFLGAQPGDALTFGQRFGTGKSNSIGTMTISWPNIGAAFYDMFTPCGGFGAGAGTSITFTVFDSCTHTPFEIVLLAFNSSDVVTNYGFLSPTFQAGGAASLTGWSAARPTTLNVTGLPAEVTSLDFELINVANGGQQLFASGGNGSPTGGAFTGMVSFDPGGERTLGELFLNRQGDYSGTVVLDGLDSFATSWTVASTPLPPWLSGSVISSGARTVDWFPIKTTGASTLDGVVALLQWNHQTTVNGTTTNTSYSWSFIVPPELTTFTLPTLPAPFASDLPAPEDFLGGQIRLLEVPSATGYDAFRAIPERNLVCPECAVRAGEIPRIIVND